MTSVFIAMCAIVGLLTGTVLGWATGWWHWISSCYMIAIVFGLFISHRYY